ncbi:hypothetical protein [Dietzia sp. 179-F 9C3 NHS]|uniref:hypothetical protein n=1 Tax=Dietzia sp. 179-F 9C3 NHS TaxID=3374295 RepID=UPI00387A4EAA
MALFAVVGLVGALLSVLLPATANAAGRLSVTSELGGVTASADGPTRFDLQGSGYQVVKGGFGGIYVAFGWVDERNWRPSQGGMTGTHYRYVPDSEAKNNQGYLGFIAFPGSSTEGEAHGTMADNGSWRLSLNVPGPRFTSEDRDGNRVTVNCLEVTCGWMTFGAHGVKNANNEAFVPVSFQAGGGGDTGAGGQAAEAGGEEAAASGAQSARGAAQRPATAQRAQGQARTRNATQQGASGGGGAAGSSGEHGGESAGADGGDDGGQAGGGGGATGGTGAGTGDIEITVDRAAARPGGALAYTAYGFWPGEQATVSLGQGIAAVGPLTTGVDGEIAGVLMIPDDIEPGTHEIRAVGAGSGLEGSVRFAVSDVGLLSTEGRLMKWGWVFITVAVLVLLGAIVFVVARRLSGRPDEEDDGDDHELPTEAYGPVPGADDFYGSSPQHSQYFTH